VNPEDDATPATSDETRATSSGTGATSSDGDSAHDDTGLDLARTLARSIAGAAKNAPRQKPRKTGKTGKWGPGQRRTTVPKASGAFPDERDPQTLDTTLGRLVADHGWSLDLKVQNVFGRWPEIVGEEVAQHCQPTSFVDGKLVVRTASTAWATQLRLLAPTLVRRLNEELGHGSVTLIEIEGPNVPSWKKGRYNSRDGRGPRDTYG
jgi:predicted nucleic acid-binding Zn ribbon protein